MTHKANCCPACGGTDLFFRAAVVAPFIAVYVFDHQIRKCRVAGCRSCGLSFFEDRYDDDELARLYTDYRGERYLAERNRQEPNYTRAFNEQVGDVTERRATYERVLAGHTVSDVLDYGGDRGQMIAYGPGDRHYVYEISGVEPVEGIIAITDPSKLGEYSLVLLCEVLEHLPEPMKVLEHAISCMAPEGLLYVTVPGNDFRTEHVPNSTLYDLAVSVAVQLHQLPSVLGKAGRRFRLGRLLLHEHINSFDALSLRTLLERGGLDVLVCSVENGSLVAISRKRSAHVCSGS